MRGKSKSTLQLEAAILEIVHERAPITVRGVCYALFVRGLIDGMTTKNTQRISRVMTNMREEDVLDWTLVVDGSRAVERVQTWRNPGQVIEAAVNGYRRDYWQDQPYLIEVWSEKSTVQGVLEPVLDKYGVTFRVMKGFGSFTSVRQAAEDSLYLNDDQDGLVFYLGDFDPSGLYMSEFDLPDRLDRYGSEWNFKRIAVTAEDTRTLVSFDVESKSGDARFDWYVENYGFSAWELDAMDPNRLRARVEEQIKTSLDLHAWDHALRIEAAQKESMLEFQAAWTARCRQGLDKHLMEADHAAPRP